jgi:TetR/AcrR family transcriptional regulator, transcriptional repressor for nem operon
MKKTETDSLTRKKLLEAAQELMLAKGYADTSVDEICAAAGLTKGSFFHYFECKEHLGTVVAEQFGSARQQLLLAAPFRQKKDPLDRVLGLLDFLMEMSRHPVAQRGCLLGTFVQELSHTHPRIRLVCAGYFRELMGFIKHDLDEAKAKYKPRARWSTQSLAEHLLAVLHGGIILAKAKQDPSAVESSVAHYKDYLKSLFAK